MDSRSFNEFILDNQIIGFFDKPIILKSGRTSHFYVNWRSATNDAFVLDRLSTFIADYITASGIPCDSLYGVPEGATKTAIIAAMKLAKKSEYFCQGSHVISMGRAAPKNHGSAQDKYFIGMPSGKTVVLEDTTTTGGSLLNTLDQLQETGVSVVAAIGLTDRMERRDDGMSVAEAIIKRYDGRIQYRSMSNALELLPLAAIKSQPKKEIIEALNQEFEQYGLKKLNLE